MSRQDQLMSQAQRLAAILAGTSISWAVAESCTGGQLAALMAREVGLGPHLDCGFVVYSFDAKHSLLGVPRTVIERNKAVNSEVALGMAQGALERSRADFAIAITGFCGPRQAKEEVGLVYIACVGRDGVQSVHDFHFGDLGRNAVLDHAVTEALIIMQSVCQDA